MDAVTASPGNQTNGANPSANFQPNASFRMNLRELSLSRMESIVNYYGKQPGALAVLAFGSLAQRQRFDDYSDLDFLVLCLPERKAQLLETVSGLDALAPVAHIQIDFEDAVKLLFCDGVLCDFGIVTSAQLPSIPHDEGRTLWKLPEFSDASLPGESGAVIPRCLPLRGEKTDGERSADVLMHLYVGLLREMRGESAAAFEEIQITAVGMLLYGLKGKTGTGGDPFSPFRRAEKAVGRELLAKIIPGYAHNLDAAKEILAVIEKETCPAALLGQVQRMLSECIGNRKSD